MTPDQIATFDDLSEIANDITVAAFAVTGLDRHLDGDGQGEIIANRMHELSARIRSDILALAKL